MGVPSRMGRWRVEDADAGSSPTLCVMLRELLYFSKAQGFS